MNVILMIIPRVSNKFTFTFFFSFRKNQKQESASWWSDNERSFYLFFTSRVLL